MTKINLGKKIQILTAGELQVGDYVHPYGRSPGGVITSLEINDNTNEYQMDIEIAGRVTQMHLGPRQMLHVSRPEEVDP